MVRGFGSGVLLGLVVAVAGLATWSELAPPPEAVRQAEAAKAAEEAAAAEAAAKALAEDARKAAEALAAQQAAEQVAAEKAAAEKATAEQAAAEKAAAEQAALAEQHKLDTEKAEIAQAAPPQVPSDGPEVPQEGGALEVPQAPSAGEDMPSLTGLDQALTAPGAATEAAPPLPEAAPDLPEAPGDALLQPGQPEGQEAPRQLPEIAPSDAPDLAPLPEVSEPAPETLPEPSPSAAPQDDQATLPGAQPLQDKLPTSVMDKEVPGVTKGKLPQVGVSPEAPAADEVALDLPAWQAFARAFEPEGKPLFAILLRDLGEKGMARADLATLPFAVSFIIDPLAPDAGEAAFAYRQAGQEILTLANGLPQGATAADVETTFAALARVLPESVAVIDQDLGGFQDQRPLATLILPVIAGQGRGLVTWDRGLNAADQIARREGVPSAVIFRRLDGEGESRQTIRRYLDRAAFKAAQEGVVVVLGDTSPETVAAILEWTVEGRAETVSLAPISAVMGR